MSAIDIAPENLNSVAQSNNNKNVRDTNPVMQCNKDVLTCNAMLTKGSKKLQEKD